MYLLFVGTNSYKLEILDLYLLNLLEMHTAYKQADSASVLQMCCKTRANERKENLFSLPSAAEFDLCQIWK